MSLSIKHDWDPDPIDPNANFRPSNIAKKDDDKIQKISLNNLTVFKADNLLSTPLDVLRIIFSRNYLDLQSMAISRFVCKLLRDLNPPNLLYPKDFMWATASDGQLNLLQWARANGSPWDERTCSLAAERGHLEVLQWARANGSPWDERTCSLAAERGHLEVLQWARANGSPWDERTCSLAAERGHLEVLQWARANGCPWDKVTCYQAARLGHLEVLQWARANGCPWDAETCFRLARVFNNLNVMNWITQFRAH